jgi:hypothetical protein
VCRPPPPRPLSDAEETAQTLSSLAARATARSPPNMNNPNNHHRAGVGAGAGAGPGPLGWWVGQHVGQLARALTDASHRRDRVSALQVKEGRKGHHHHHHHHHHHAGGSAD